MNPEILALMIPIIGVCIPIVAIITGHQRKLAEIKAQKSGNLSAEMQAEMDALRNEVAALRDTTTRFDMSFDAAITRLEDRVDHVEVKQTGTAGAAHIYQNANGETQTLRQGAAR